MKKAVVIVCLIGLFLLWGFNFINTELLPSSNDGVKDTHTYLANVANGNKTTFNL